MATCTQACDHTDHPIDKVHPLYLKTYICMCVYFQHEVDQIMVLLIMGIDCTVYVFVIVNRCALDYYNNVASLLFVETPIHSKLKLYSRNISYPNQFCTSEHCMYKILHTKMLLYKEESVFVEMRPQMQKFMSGELPVHVSLFLDGTQAYRRMKLAKSYEE